MAGSDDLLDYTSKIDALVDRIDALLEQQAQRGQVQTINNRTTVSGLAIAIAAIVTSVASLVLMVAFMVIENRSYSHLDRQMDTLQAWRGVQSAAIAKLQAEHQQKTP